MACRGWRYRRWVETHWYQCLGLPGRAWSLLFGLAVVMTGLSGAIALALPGWLSDARAEGSWMIWLGLPCLSLPLLVFGYGTGFLDCVLASGMAGQVGHIRWPGRDFGMALKSGARWLTCFLAGPIVPAVAGLLYWVHAGELGFWDWTILAELNVLALSWWFLLLVAVNQPDWPRALNPLRLVGLVRRLGDRLVVWAVLASTSGLAHAWLAGVALEKVHHDFLLGWSLLLLSWASGMFFATFLFRWVGVWFYWDRIYGKESFSREPPESAKSPRSQGARG